MKLQRLPELSASGGDEFQSVFASGPGRRRRERDSRREEKDEDCYRKESRQRDRVTVQMPTQRLTVTFFPNKHNNHVKSHSWLLITHEMPALV